MKKSKLTIAVLSACMLAATGGISLGVAALANAPEAIKAPESSLIAGQIISEGIKVKREVSKNGDQLEFTYSITPSSASNTNISVSLAWNAANPNNPSIDDFLTADHYPSAKKIVVNKKAMFRAQAKLVLTASGGIGNPSATVLIDCLGFATLISTNGASPITAHTESGYVMSYGDTPNLAAANFSDAVGKAFSVTWGSENDTVGIYGAEVVSEKMYFDNSATASSASFANAHTPSEGGDTTWFDENSLSFGKTPDSDGIWGSIGFDQDLVYTAAKRFCSGVYGHIQAVIKLEVLWDSPKPDGTGFSTNDNNYVYAAYVWDFDFTSYYGPASITAEAGHIYF